MAMSIKEISELCGVSEQAIRGWCRRNHVAKDAKGSFATTETIEMAILSHYGAVGAKAAKASCETCCESSETIETAVLDVLREEIKAKNAQIEELQKELSIERKYSREISEKLAILVDQSQKLQLTQMNISEKLEENQQKDDIVKRENSKKWWEFWR